MDTRTFGIVFENDTNKEDLAKAAKRLYYRNYRSRNKLRMAQIQWEYWARKGAAMEHGAKAVQDENNEHR